MWRGRHLREPDVAHHRRAADCPFRQQRNESARADQAVQIPGGSGFMRGSRAERIYREVKVMMIGCGAEEIMKDLAAKQLGY